VNGNIAGSKAVDFRKHLPSPIAPELQLDCGHLLGGSAALASVCGMIFSAEITEIHGIEAKIPFDIRSHW